MSNWDRFAGRVEDYVRYRPSYASEAVRFLLAEGALTRGAPVADVGSGSGIFSKQLLDSGLEVFAVEPGAEMRASAEAYLSSYLSFHSLAGDAQATGLRPASVEMISAAQAFHWFDPVPTRREWQRVLTPRGLVALLWNVRNDDPGLGADYEAFVQDFSVDYREVVGGNQRADARVGQFFGEQKYDVRKFDNLQRLDWERLWGRYRSTSYSPAPDHPKFADAESALRELFARYERNGFVELANVTEVYFGRLDT